jgi:hypothetical protein
MRITVLLLSLLLFMACAKGYKENPEGNPLTGQDLALAQKATEFSKKVDEIDDNAPSSLGASWKAFTDSVRLFENNCQRKSCNSLEAREDFNHIRYYAVQLDSMITQNAYPQFYPAWETIRKDYVDSIGKELGYRIDKEAY